MLMHHILIYSEGLSKHQSTCWIVGVGPIYDMDSIFQSIWDCNYITATATRKYYQYKYN